MEAADPARAMKKRSKSHIARVLAGLNRFTVTPILVGFLGASMLIIEARYVKSPVAPLVSRSSFRYYRASSETNLVGRPGRHVIRSRYIAPERSFDSRPPQHHRIRWDYWLDFSDRLALHDVHNHVRLGKRLTRTKDDEVHENDC
jgi:hypothetical protein